MESERDNVLALHNRTLTVCPRSFTRSHLSLSLAPLPALPPSLSRSSLYAPRPPPALPWAREELLYFVALEPPHLLSVFSPFQKVDMRESMPEQGSRGGKSAKITTEARAAH